MSAPAPAVAILERGNEPEWLEDFTACEDCAGHLREAAELRARLAKAWALLRTLRRLEPRPVKAEGLDDDPEALAAISAAVYVATVRARIDHFLQSAK